MIRWNRPLCVLIKKIVYLFRHSLHKSHWFPLLPSCVMSNLLQSMCLNVNHYVSHDVSHKWILQISLSVLTTFNELHTHLSPIITLTKYTYKHYLVSCWTLTYKRKLSPIIVMIIRGMNITWNFIARELTRRIC